MHLMALIIGFTAYIFSDVNSDNGFTNTFLPLLVLFSFIYGVIVTINMIYNMRNKTEKVDRSSELLFESMKEYSKKESATEDVNRIADP